MWSGRKESVRRHIDNPNIHMGNGIAISFSDSLLKRLTGATFPNPLTSASHNRRNSNLFPNTPEKMFAMFEKAYSQKIADKIADKIVNFDITYQTQPAYYNYNVPNLNYANDFYTSIKDLYGLEMHVCPECLMIEPAKISYAKGEPSAGIRSSISFPWCPPPNYESESQKGQHLRVLMESRIYPHLKKWLDVLMPSPKDRTIVAIPVPQLSPSNSMCKVRLSVNDPESVSRKKYMTIEYLKEKCYDLLLSSDTESNHWSARVLHNESTSFVDDEVMDYLSHTKHSTFGFFRIKRKYPLNYSKRIHPGGSIYLIILLFSNNPIPAIDSVFDAV
jgi:hypothetical protein